MQPFSAFGRASSLKGEISLLGDKSIAHRALIIASLAQGKTSIENFPASKDCLYTKSALKKLGVRIIQNKGIQKGSYRLLVFGRGLSGLSSPKGDIFTGNSGTTFRLLLGVLAGQNFKVRLMAGSSLAKRPMFRVTEPLRQMGARINAKRKTQNLKPEEYPPITIKGGNLKPITYRMPLASAQVKSAILLAGLYVDAGTKIIEPIKTRDHTERMLKLFKAQLKIRGKEITIKGPSQLHSPGRIYIPGDISSAGFFIVLAALLPNSRLAVKGVSLNPSRLGIIRVLKRMGADIRIKYSGNNFEPAGDILIKGSELKGAVVKKEEIPSLIDELPILMVAASLARGKTIFKAVGELRVKETDRIRSMSANLRKMGADIKIVRDGSSEDIVILGVKKLKGAKVKSFGDHRTAMGMIVARLLASGRTEIEDIACIDKSFPKFIRLLESVIR